MTMINKVTLILTTILLFTSLASCGEQTTFNTVTPTSTPLLLLILLRHKIQHQRIKIHLSVITQNIIHS